MEKRGLGLMILTLQACCSLQVARADLESDARDWLSEYDVRRQQVSYKSVLASWAYNTNITEENQQAMLAQNAESAAFALEAQRNATFFLTQMQNSNENILDQDVLRQLDKLKVIGDAVLDEAMYAELSQHLADMRTIYSTGRVCKEGEQEGSCSLRLDPELAKIMAESRNYDELLFAWKGWRDAVGPPMREKYMKFVDLTNTASRMQGFSDTGERWRSGYKRSLDDMSESFKDDMERLYRQLLPLYQQLHAYVRRKLAIKYGTDKVDVNGAIPAHLLGNMWAQSWGNTLNFTQPFAGKESLDVTNALIEQGYDALKMFQLSEKFFVDLGLVAMPEEFWKNSMLTRPEDGREVVCHASAWDFYNGKDFRIKMCTSVTMQQLIVIHHEMGHIQYYLQYKDQPALYRRGANSGFHEAVGDLLALSVATPAHLKKINLLHEVVDDPETDINFLFKMALGKIAFIPFGYLMDKWRWGLFSGEISKEKANQEWWKLRDLYQGVKSDVTRSEMDFDPGAKFHVPGNTPYIRYFVSFVLQFQLHKAVCSAAGHRGPLHKCDIDGSKQAGKKLADMLRLGSSRPWPEALQQVTGTDQLDASAVVEYFQPLIDWLTKANSDNGETIGWGLTLPPIGDCRVAHGSEMCLPLNSDEQECYKKGCCYANFDTVSVCFKPRN